MRIYEPKNQDGYILLNEDDFNRSTFQITKTLEEGKVVIDSTDIEDIECWEVETVTVTVNGEEISITPDIERDCEGSIINLIFAGKDENPGFVKATIQLGRISEKTYETVDMKIAQLMERTLVDSRKPDYDQTDNLYKWSALGYEAFETDPERFKYANESSLPTDFTAGPVVDDCLIGLSEIPTNGVPVAEGVDTIVWNSDLPSLEDNENRSPFTSGPTIIWNGKMPNLVNGSVMFHNCTGLKSWNVDLPAGLQNAEYMFYNCIGLTKWDVELPLSLQYASGMFYGCTGLKYFSRELPEGLQDASHMFSHCTGLTSWTVDLPFGLQNASYMFEGCSGLTEWTGDLPAGLQNATGMFRRCTGLTSWNIDLPTSITNTSQMFQGCSGLTSWNIDFPARVTNATGMFKDCISLSEWTVELPSNLTSAHSMFEACHALTSFIADLSHITNGESMFQACINLSNFYGSPEGLKSLSNGQNMFIGCKLDYASIQHIAYTLPTVTGTHNINIGYDPSKITAEQIAACEDTIVREKNWQLTWNMH